LRLTRYLLGLFVVVALVVVGCAPEAAQPAEEEAAPAEEEEAEEAAAPAAPSAETFEWRCQTVSPSGENDQWAGETYNCDAIRDMSGGRLDITPYPANALLPTAEIFEAVAGGTVEAGQDYPSYWNGVNYAFGPLNLMPFGLGPQDYSNWVWAAGGLKCYQDLYARYGLMYFPNWVQPMESGFRTNKPIRTLKDFDGLKLRGAGFEVKDVLQMSGAEIITVAPGDIWPALERGVIDGLEMGPVSYDWQVGIQEATKYWCLPGWHQPGTVHGFMMNIDKWNELPDDLKSIVEHACKSTWEWTTTRMDWNSAIYYPNFEEYGIEITRLSDKDLSVLQGRLLEVQARLAAENADYAAILKSQFDFLEVYKPWRDAQGDYAVQRPILRPVLP
jgi:TRAP-type mannitol/chloroaromatic compound transport system substrate-binding protein